MMCFVDSSVKFTGFSDTHHFSSGRNPFHTGIFPTFLPSQFPGRNKKKERHPFQSTLPNKSTEDQTPTTTMAPMTNSNNNNNTSNDEQAKTTVINTSLLLSKRRVGTARPSLKNPAKPSPTNSPSSSEKNLLSAEKKRMYDDENQSVYSFSSTPSGSPNASPETIQKFISSSNSIEILPSASNLLTPAKPKLKLYFGGPKNITPFTLLKRQKNHHTTKTSLILELKLLHPNFQDLLTILETVPNSVNERDDEGMTSLMLVCSTQVTYLSTSERLAFCRIVKQKFPKQFELTDNYGLTALHHAVQFMPSPCLRIIQLLLSVYPLAASVLDMSRSLPLHHAVVGASSNSILKLLILANPASVSQQDGTGLTALDYVKSKVKIPSRRTRIILSVDGVWVDPQLFTMLDTTEPDPEENFAAIFLQSWFRQINKKIHQNKVKQPLPIIGLKKESNIKSPSSSSSSQYKQSLRPKPKAPIATVALSSWHHDAATMIQALSRGAFLRLRIMRGKESVVNIQRIIRGYLLRNKLWRQYPMRYPNFRSQRLRLMRKSKASESQRSMLSSSSSPSSFSSKATTTTVPTTRKNNWETAERHSQLYFADTTHETKFSPRMTPPPSPVPVSVPVKAPVSVPRTPPRSIASSSSSTTTKSTTALISQRIKSASLIRACWLKYQARNLLPTLSYRSSLTKTLFPFYLESLLTVVFYFGSLKFLFGSNQTFNENPFVVSSFIEPINSLLSPLVGSKTSFLFSFQLAEQSLLLTMISLLTTLFTLQYLFLAPLQRDQPITPATKLIHKSYQHIYQFSHQLSLTCLTISWFLVWIVIYSHFQSILGTIFNTLTSGTLAGGIILSFLMIPLILYPLALSHIYNTPNRKWTNKK